MADQGIKKVTVLKNALPPINAEEEKYVVRYRIISEDRNRISHWSPQFSISPEPVSLEAAEDQNIILEFVGDSLIAKWNVSSRAQEEFAKNPSLSLSSYDVYVAWGSQQGSTEPITSAYFATVSGNYISIPKDPSAASVRVVVQNMTYPRQYLPRVAIADSGVFDI